MSNAKTNGKVIDLMVALKESLAKPRPAVIHGFVTHFQRGSIKSPFFVWQVPSEDHAETNIPVAIVALSREDWGAIVKRATRENAPFGEDDTKAILRAALDLPVGWEPSEALTTPAAEAAPAHSDPTVKESLTVATPDADAMPAECEFCGPRPRFECPWCDGTGVQS